MKPEEALNAASHNKNAAILTSSAGLDQHERCIKKGEREQSECRILVEDTCCSKLQSASNDRCCFKSAVSVSKPYFEQNNNTIILRFLFNVIVI